MPDIHFYLLNYSMGTKLLIRINKYMFLQFFLSLIDTYPKNYITSLSRYHNKIIPGEFNRNSFESLVFFFSQFQLIIFMFTIKFYCLRNFSQSPFYIFTSSLEDKDFITYGKILIKYLEKSLLEIIYLK